MEGMYNFQIQRTQLKKVALWLIYHQESEDQAGEKAPSTLLLNKFVKSG